MVFLVDVMRGDDNVVSVGKLRSNADTAFSQGEFDHALSIWAQVVQLEPNNENNFYKIFRIHLRQSKLKEALSDLNSALRIKPDFENALAQRAKIQIRLGRCNEADADFNLLRRYILL